MSVSCFDICNGKNLLTSNLSHVVWDYIFLTHLNKSIIALATNSNFMHAYHYLFVAVINITSKFSFYLNNQLIRVLCLTNMVIRCYTRPIFNQPNMFTFVTYYNFFSIIRVPYLIPVETDK